MADENERQDDRNEETVPLTTVELRDTHRASTPTPETTGVSFFNETIAAMPRALTPPPPPPPAPPAPPVVPPAANK